MTPISDMHGASLSRTIRSPPRTLARRTFSSFNALLHRSGASIVIRLNKRAPGILIEGSSLAFLPVRHSRRATVAHRFSLDLKVLEVGFTRP